MDKVKKPTVLEFWLTRDQWVQFTRVMERCHRVAGGPVGPAECLELICRNYLESDGRLVGHQRPASISRD